VALTCRKGALFISVLVLGLGLAPLRSVWALGGLGENYPEHIWSGLERSFSNPRWLFAAGAVAALSNFDMDVKQKGSGTLLPSILADCGDWYGLGLNYLTGSCIVLGDGWANDRISKKETLEKLQYLTEAYVLTQSFTQVVKLVTHRERPDGSNRLSFPSAHTSGSFSVASSLNQFYGMSASIPTYALATLSGLSRINDNKHWLSDVLSGALLGQLLGDGFARLYHERNRPRSASGNQGVVLLVSFTF